jgi:hypothetical protein
MNVAFLPQQQCQTRMDWGYYAGYRLVLVLVLVRLLVPVLVLVPVLLMLLILLMVQVFP